MITKTMTIGEVLKQSRDVAPIFMEYGMHCLSCPCATSESIEMACAAHGANADELVEKLNGFFAEKE